VKLVVSGCLQIVFEVTKIFASGQTKILETFHQSGADDGLMYLVAMR
jgi:hypothetical protein